MCKKLDEKWMRMNGKGRHKLTAKTESSDAPLHTGGSIPTFEISRCSDAILCCLGRDVFVALRGYSLIICS